MPGHQTTFVKFGHREANIDVGISELILELWKLDIDTLNSCEDNVPKGWVWIEFWSAMDAEKFLSIAARRYDEHFEGVYQRIVRCWQKWESNHGRDWKYSVRPVDISVDWKYFEDGSCSGVASEPADIMFSVSVRFPKKDLAAVLRRLQQHNLKE